MATAYRGNRQREGWQVAIRTKPTPAPLLHGWHITGKTPTGEIVYGLNRGDNLAILYRHHDDETEATGWKVETTVSDRAWFYPDTIPGCPRYNHLDTITNDTIDILLSGEIKVICGWCGKHLSGPVDAKQVSHGICEDCSAEMLEGLRKPQTDQDFCPAAYGLAKGDY